MEEEEGEGAYRGVQGVPVDQIVHLVHRNRSVLGNQLVQVDRGVRFLHLFLVDRRVLGDQMTQLVQGVRLNRHLPGIQSHQEFPAHRCNPCHLGIPCLPCLLYFQMIPLNRKLLVIHLDLFGRKYNNYVLS